MKSRISKKSKRVQLRKKDYKDLEQNPSLCMNCLFVAECTTDQSKVVRVKGAFGGNPVVKCPDFFDYNLSTKQISELCDKPMRWINQLLATDDDSQICEAFSKESGLNISCYKNGGRHRRFYCTLHKGEYNGQTDD